MNTTAIILGLGPSVKLFTENPALQRHFAGAAIFGVNDIWKHYPVPHLLILDGEEKFSEERRTTILNSRPEHLYLWTLDKWPTMPNREYLGPITDFAGDLTLPHLQKPKVISSTWVAAQCAWLKGYRRIILFGADYTQHRNLSEQAEDIAQGYRELGFEMFKSGGGLYIYEASCKALQGIVPYYPMQSVSAVMNKIKPVANYDIASEDESERVICKNCGASSFRAYIGFIIDPDSIRLYCANCNHQQI